MFTNRPDSTPRTSAARRTTSHFGALRAGAAALAIVLMGLVLPAGRAMADVTFDQRMLELINQDRAANGLNPVVADPTLGGTAEDAPYSGCGFVVNGRAMDMGQRNYFSHTILGCGLQSVFNILNSTGIVTSGTGENIAWANALTDPLVAAANLENQLMNSPDHRANILNPNFTRVGVGSWHTAPGQTWSGGGYALGNVYIAVQIFAGGAVSTPPTTTPPTTTPPTTTPPTTPPGGGFHAVTPSRILDTRTGNGAAAAPLAPGGTLNLQVTGRGGVPATGVAAVVMNVAITGPTAPSYLTVFPTGEAMPVAANVNFVAGDTVSNMVTAKVGTGGQVSIYNPAGSVHVIADVAGWYDAGSDATGGGFHPLTPARILDTRSGNGSVAAPVDAGATLNLQVTGRAGVPTAGVSAVVMNVAVTGPTAPSYLTAFPTGATMPLAANLNFGPGQTLSNTVTAKVGTNGQVSLYNAAGAVQVIADVAGWYDAGNDATGAKFHPVTPARILDDRTGNGAPAGALGAGATLNLQATGRGGVPSTGVSGVVLNVAVTQPTAPSYLTAYPAGVVMPLAANLNFVPNQTVSNLVVAKVGANGQVSIYNAAGATYVIADMAGWFDGP